MIGIKHEKRNVPQRRGLHRIDEKLHLVKHLKNCIDNNELDELRPCQVAKFLMASDACARIRMTQLKKYRWIDFDGNNYQEMKILIDIDVDVFG
ncbi:MAG: hypothetical protein OEZ01_15695 [Candidatus Heimdallarchaeota archaeon]|nr:hypothetical protein [Candidatus Heimdallarchaeota archaeon]